MIGRSLLRGQVVVTLYVLVSHCSEPTMKIGSLSYVLQYSIYESIWFFLERKYESR